MNEGFKILAEKITLSEFCFHGLYLMPSIRPGASDHCYCLEKKKVTHKVPTGFDLAPKDGNSVFLVPGEIFIENWFTAISGLPGSVNL